MTKKLPNKLVLEEGMNEVVLKRAGAEYEIVRVLVTIGGDFYCVSTLADTMRTLQFKDRKFVKAYGLS